MGAWAVLNMQLWADVGDCGRLWRVVTAMDMHVRVDISLMNEVNPLPTQTRFDL